MKVFVSVLVAVFLTEAASHESRFDEYFWTKGTWTDFKFVKSYESWRVEDDPLVAQHSSHYCPEGCDFISTAGPRSRSQLLQPSTDSAYQDWLVGLVNQVVAGESVLGAVCESIVQHSWTEVVSSILNKDSVGPEETKSIVQNICPSVVQDVLHRYRIIRKQQNEERGPEWILSPRDHDSVESYEETSAIQSICDQLVSTRSTEFKESLLGALQDYEKVLKRLLKRQIDRAKELEEDKAAWDDSVCLDAHPSCEKWADSGECVLNPNYMLHFCRISCGVCIGESTFSKRGKYYFSKDTLQELENKNQNLRNAIQNGVCFPSTPIDGLKRNIQVLEYEPILQGKEIADVQRALYVELKGRCLLLYRGWWTYELCFFSKLTQVHIEDDGKTLGQTIQIGSFSIQEAHNNNHLQLAGEDMKSMGFPEKPRNFILQTYEGGDDCEVDGETRPRRAEVRFLCSEGLQLQTPTTAFVSATIEEMEECFYVIHVFLPLLCHYSDYKA